MLLALIDMVVIPGLAFDRPGYRVGRGRWFYDRFLAQKDFQGIRCGLCFHEQIQNQEIPCEPHDVPMDLIVTDVEVIRCQGESGTLMRRRRHKKRSLLVVLPVWGVVSVLVAWGGWQSVLFRRTLMGC